MKDFIPSMLDRKASFVESAIDELPELENRTATPGSDHLPLFISVVSLLDAYPMGICPVPGGKLLVYRADGLVSTALAVLWKDDFGPADVVLVGELLEDALESLSDVKALCKGKKQSGEFVKQPAPGIYRSKVDHVQKAFDELSTIALQLRLKRSVRRQCAAMATLLETFPTGFYSNSPRHHKTPLSNADSLIFTVNAFLYSDSVIDSFTWKDHDQLDSMLSEALEILNAILIDAEANAPGYYRKGNGQPKKVKPLPVAKKSP